MAKNEGTATIRYNTFMVPDVIALSYEGHEIVRTTCLGTVDLFKGSDSIPGVGWISCGEKGKDAQGRDFRWCAITFGFGPGTGTKIEVSVEPNCSGTPDTQWEFVVTCPK
ncbi:MAG TPA: hypothetical protein VGB13_02400 [Candidatus Krumholzibacteria bacterium]